MLKNVLIWFIATCGVFLQLYLMHIRNILIHSSTITTNIPGFIYFCSKFEVFSIFQQYVTYVEAQFSSGIKVLMFDSGGVYMSREFHEFLNQNSMVSQHFCPYTPQQNDVAERTNHHLLDVAHTLLLESFVPFKSI